MKIESIRDGGFKFPPNQNATKWEGTAPEVVEIVATEAVDAILLWLVKNQPGRIREVFRLNGYIL